MQPNRATIMLAGTVSLAALLVGCSSNDADPEVEAEEEVELVTADQGVPEDCEPANEFPTVNEGALTVVPYEFLPYAGVDESTNELVGVDGEIVSNIAQRECLDLQLLQLPTASALEALTTDRADLVVGGWYWTEERGEEFGQTTPGYYDFISVISKNENAYETIDELDDMTLAMAQGFLWIEEMQELFGEESVNVYQTPDAAINDVNAGRVDAAFVGSGEGAYITSQQDDLVALRIEPDERLAASQEANGVNYPHKKSNTELTDALNENIETFREDGTIEELLQDWDYNDPATFDPEV